MNRSTLLNVNIEGISIKKVEKFKYLGSMMSEDGRCDSEIRARIGLARTSFGEMRSFSTNLSLNELLKGSHVKRYMWSGVLYGCESWAINATMQKTLEATAMWLMR